MSNQVHLQEMYDFARANTFDEFVKKYSLQDLYSSVFKQFYLFEEKTLDNEIDRDELDEDEIETVMQQANCSRIYAVKALKKHGSIVDAILELMP